MGLLCVEARLNGPPPRTPAGKLDATIPLSTRGNLFRSLRKEAFLGLTLNTTPEKLPAGAAMEFVEGLTWQGENDLFAAKTIEVNLAWFLPEGKLQFVKIEEAPRLKKYFATGAVAAPDQVRFQAGNIDDKSRDSLDLLTPEEFRLARGSPGHGMLPGGKDVGADVDLVGPGVAYERWKKTPDYQAWRKKTAELMAAP